MADYELPGIESGLLCDPRRGDNGLRWHLCSINRLVAEDAAGELDGVENERRQAAAVGETRATEI